MRIIGQIDEKIKLGIVSSLLSSSNLAGSWRLRFIVDTGSTETIIFPKDVSAYEFGLFETGSSED